MLECLAVAVGGAVGAVCRYLVGLIPIGTQEGFPIKTLMINVAGAFLIGIISSVAEKYSVSPLLALALKTGVCGGFTTFSTFALETDQLLQSGNYILAIAYILSSVLLSIGAVFLAQTMIQ